MILFFSINLIVLGLAVIVFWRLSEYGEERGFLYPAIRWAVSFLLVEVGYWGFWRYCRYDDRPAGFLYIITCVSLTFIWIGHITGYLAEVFHRLIDPSDNRPYNPRKEQEELDRIGDLIRSGRKQEAIELCQALKETTDVNHSALELTLEHLGVPQERVQNSRPLREAHRLRLEGKYDEAEIILKSLLRKNPSNSDAALMLMRLYAENLKRGDKATEVLQSLEKQPHVSSAYIEFARRSIDDWQRPQPPKPPPEPVPETLDELLAKRYFGTATDILEQQIKEDPKNFDAWMKLIEIHAGYCANFQLAEKTVRRMERNPAFNAEQMEQVLNKLTEWKLKGSIADKPS